ncbi:MAG TPA: YfhD family protein [Bacillales bacterium]|nr:YfhD family protein [Bacillales bacterium]
MAKSKKSRQHEPVARAEDVEYSKRAADEDDREARERAGRADQRAKR